MGIEIRVAEKLTDKEPRQLFDWGEDILNVNAYHFHWRALHEPAEFDQPSGRVAAPLAAMVLLCRNAAWSSGHIY